jgi:hypothetical protein
VGLLGDSNDNTQGDKYYLKGHIEDVREVEGARRIPEMECGHGQSEQSREEEVESLFAEETEGEDSPEPARIGSVIHPFRKHFAIFEHIHPQKNHVPYA